MYSKYHIRIFLIIVTGFLLSLPAIGSAQANQNQTSGNPQTKPYLESPRRTLHTFFYWQQEGHERPEMVAETMSKASGMSTQNKRELAQQLLDVFHARGLTVNYDNIPSDPQYTDSLSGLHRYTPFPDLSQIYLVKDAQGWVFSERSVEQIPEIYRATFSVFVDLILDNLPPFLHQEWLGVKLWQILGIFSWILVGFILRKIFEFLLSNYLRRLTQKTSSHWDDTLLSEAEKPAGFTFMMLYFGGTFSFLHLGIDINYYLSPIIEVAISVGLIWLLYKLSNVLSDYLYEKTLNTDSKLDDQLVPLLRKTTKIFILIFGILLVLQNQGINVASLLAGLGLGGLAFALAARDTLANFFGSLTIFLDKPFVVGDWIKTSEVEGTVEEVGFRSTRIRTFYNSLVSVPNAKLADAEIDNLGLRQYRRISTTLNLTYDTTPQQLEAFVEGIKALIKANSKMRQDFYEVHFYDYGSHSLDIMVYCFLEVATWSDEMQQRHNFLLDIKRLAKDVGVEFAFPTQTLHVDSFHKDEVRKARQERSEEELSSAVLEYGPNGNKSNPEGIQLREKDGGTIDFSASLHRSGSSG